MLEKGLFKSSPDLDLYKNRLARLTYVRSKVEGGGKVMNKKGKENKQLLLPKYHHKPLPPSPFNNGKRDIIKMDRV